MTEMNVSRVSVDFDDGVLGTTEEEEAGFDLELDSRQVLIEYGRLGPVRFERRWPHDDLKHRRPRHSSDGEGFCFGFFREILLGS